MIRPTAAARAYPTHLPQPPCGRLVVIGADKASAAIAAAVKENWPGELSEQFSGLVVTYYAQPCRNIEIVEAAHPVPDIVGMNAADMPPRKSLDGNNGHGFLEALNDQVITGPTPTNVNDFRAVLIGAGALAQGSLGGG